MRTVRIFLIGLTVPFALLLAPFAVAQTSLSKQCADGVCKVKVTPQQLLAAAEKLVHMGKYAEARPLIEALRKAPGYTLQTRFLTGYIAEQQGRYGEAAAQYRAILSDDPSQTNVRLELARTMMAQHEYQSADRQFKIVEQDKELPPEVARTIRVVRDVIRSHRAWRLDVDLGIAPDTNINNATNAGTVNVLLGDIALPLTLDPSAQAHSGLGETATISAGLRLPVGKQVVIQTSMDAVGTNYGGIKYDDYQLQFAAGPELAINDHASIAIGGVAAQRWYGGQVVTRQIGVQGGAQTTVGKTDRLGLQIDVRRSDVKFDHNYDGWQSSLYTTYEHALSKAVTISASAFARRDWLKAQAYSSKEFGLNLGVGGELPHGINFGVSVGGSRAAYDAPLYLFSAEPRRDWRYNTRVTLGDRKIRVLGFSPEVSFTYSRNQSSLTLYDIKRTRFQFSLARYF